MRIKKFWANIGFKIRIKVLYGYQKKRNDDLKDVVKLRQASHDLTEKKKRLEQLKKPKKNKNKML